MAPWPLSVALPLTLLGSVVLIVGFDAVAAALTRSRPHVYRKLWPVQFGLYVAIGYVAMLTLLDLRLVELVGALAGFAESTIGWVITWRFGPGRVPNAAPLSIGAVVLWMTALGFGLAIAGALLFNVTARALLHAR